MERMFNMRWWDYSNRFLNINGRVCLINSILFGIMGIIIIYFVHPSIKYLIENKIHYYIKISLFIILFTVLAIDFIVSTLSNADTIKLILKYNDYSLKKEQEKLVINKRQLKRLKRINSHYPTLWINDKINTAKIYLKDLIDRL